MRQYHQDLSRSYFLPLMHLVMRQCHQDLSRSYFLPLMHLAMRQCHRDLKHQYFLLLKHLAVRQCHRDLKHQYFLLMKHLTVRQYPRAYSSALRLHSRQGHRQNFQTRGYLDRLVQRDHYQVYQSCRRYHSVHPLNLRTMNLNHFGLTDHLLEHHSQQYLHLMPTSLDHHLKKYLQDHLSQQDHRRVESHHHQVTHHQVNLSHQKINHLGHHLLQTSLLITHNQATARYPMIHHLLRIVRYRPFSALQQLQH